MFFKHKSLIYELNWTYLPIICRSKAHKSPAITPLTTKKELHILTALLHFKQIKVIAPLHIFAFCNEPLHLDLAYQLKLARLHSWRHLYPSSNASSQINLITLEVNRSVKCRNNYGCRFVLNEEGESSWIDLELVSSPKRQGWTGVYLSTIYFWKIATGGQVNKTTNTKINRVHQKAQKVQRIPKGLLITPLESH